MYFLTKSARETKLSQIMPKLKFQILLKFKKKMPYVISYMLGKTDF